uniref:Uncharacterized protein n=1 Tax=Arundo donax TaxID=35708 RepID=A0A0A9EN81_ARUDO
MAPMRQGRSFSVAKGGCGPPCFTILLKKVLILLFKC